MKCNNPNCGGEWAPPTGKNVTVCPFCQEPIAGEKKPSQSLDNVTDTLAYIKEQFGVETLLGKKAYTYFADLTHNQLRDDTDLIKQLCDKGALDCMKAAIGKPDTEHEKAIRRALSKLPKYLQDSPTVTDMLHDFAELLEWTIQRHTIAPQPKQNSVGTQHRLSNNTGIIVAPPVGSIIRVADIEWSVLTVENNKALLISEKILEKRPYNVKKEDVTWKTCTLRKYLNEEFYNSLGTMKLAIAETRISNSENPWYETKGGKATTDKIFLLSLEELVKYFGDSGDLSNKKRYGWEHSYYVLQSRGYLLHDQYDSARKANRSSWHWWLRSPGYSSSYAAIVFGNGSVNVNGYRVSHHDVGVCPALWLYL